MHDAGFLLALFGVMTIGSASIALVRQYPGGPDVRRFQGYFKVAGFALVGRGAVDSPT